MESFHLNNIVNTEHRKKHDKYIQYGTAGFRTKSELLDHVMYRMGILAVLRSKVKKAAIGLMITASHNLEPDNGVKLVDPEGEMLEVAWEHIATELVNVEDSGLESVVQRIIEQEKIDMLVDATVITGRDTRSSSPALLKAAVAGIESLNGTLKDFGVVTTPQLHYLVVCTNSKGKYGEATLEGYYKKLSEAFRLIRGENSNKGQYSSELLLDAANGVGAIAVREFTKHLGTSLTITIHNDGNGQLNHTCGADYVKVQQAPPTNFPQKPNVRCVSLDGDADRIIYFYTDKDKKFQLLDGDRIATLTAAYFKQLLEESGLNLELGLVQTAYANGSSTNYISNVLKVPVACVSTGIKHLHARAKGFDIGVYFEANGHGTVILKNAAMEVIKQATTDESLPASQRNAASKLVNTIDVINQTVGDAISDMLLVETILHAKGWNAMDWKQSYNDLPNQQLKVKVNDRNTIVTVDAERRCVAPAGLQEEIDNVVAKYLKARSFVRPSGTEDVVRVYGECEDPSDLRKLMLEVASAVYRFAGGVGPEPVL